MSIRTDILVDFNVSPRIITVEAPSTELTMQDLVDTMRTIEDDLLTGMSQPKILDAAGKEGLGGGVLVGITVILQNAQITFEERNTEAATGTATSNSTLSLIDTGADFVSAGAARGSIVINHTDGSSATVRTVVDANTLLTFGLAGGSGNDFEIGDSYDVYNIVQCEISGGNLVALDDMGADLNPVYQSFGTQIVRTASSSATLQELEAIQFSSYNGGVTVDLTGLHLGTEFPVGTLQKPVNNFSDALAIAQERGLSTFYVVGDATIDTGLDFSNKVFVGQGINLSSFMLDPTANFTNATFTDATITGTLDGDSIIESCEIGNLTFVTGVISGCILTGTVVLGGGTVAQIIDCVDGVAGLGIPTIDMGGDGPDLNVRNYSGGLQLTNKTGSAEVSISMNSGRVLIDSTVTSGTVLIRGVAKVVDNSVGATVDVGDMIQPAQVNTAMTRVALLEKFSKNKLVTDPSTGVMTLYDDDDTTPLLTAQLYEDVAGTQTYRGQGAERREQLA